MASRSQLIIILSVTAGLAVLLSGVGCGATPTPTLTPPPTATHTSTTTPSVTPTSSSTPTPTLTPTPTPTPIPASFYVDQGDRLLRSHDWAGAERAYQQAIEAEEDYVPAYTRLSYLYTLLPGREADGLGQAQRAVEVAPDSAAALAYLAHAQVAVGHSAKALETAKKAVELGPEDAVVQRFLAEAYLEERYYDKALAAARRAVELADQDPEAHRILAQVHREMNQSALARQELEAAADLDPGFVRAPLSLGIFYAFQEDYETAAGYFEDALELAPDYVPALVGLGLSKAYQGQPADRQRIFTQAAQLAPASSGVYTAWGQAFLVDDSYSLAEDRFKQAIQLNPDDWQAYAGLGWTYYYSDKCDEAGDQFKKIIERRPRLGAGYIGLGFSQACLGLYDLAVQRFGQAIELEPYNADAQIGLGDAYSGRGDHAKALQAYQAARRLRSHDPTALLGIGQAYFSQDERVKATEAYEEALELDADLAEAHLGLGALYLLEKAWDQAEEHYLEAAALAPEDTAAYRGLGDVYHQQGKLDQAKEAYQKALRYGSRDPQVLVGLGAVSLEQGDLNNAVQTLQNAVEADPTSPLAHFHLGRAYRERGDYEEARAAFETYLALEPGAPAGNRIRATINLLERGYMFTEAEAAEAIQEAVGSYQIELVEVAVEAEAGRHLSAVFQTGEDITSFDFLLDLSVVIGTSAAAAALLEPPLDGGLVVVARDLAGADLVRGSIPTKTIRRWWDGLIADDAFLTHMSITDLTAAPADVKTVVADIAEATSEERRLTPKAEVPYELMTRQALKEFLTRRYYEKSTPEKRRVDKEVLVILGLIPANLDLDQLLIDLNTEQVLGFYDLEKDIFYLVTETEMLGVVDKITLAHEYTHALQDQYFDLSLLQETDPENSDAHLALRALVEGDATLAMGQYIQAYGTPLELVQISGQIPQAESPVLDRAPKVIRELMMFPYVKGLAFVRQAYSGGDWEAVGDLYTALPQSTEQIIHPEKYTAGDEPTAVSLPDFREVLAGDWRQLDTDTLGEFGARVYLGEHLSPWRTAYAAEGWDGDRYAFLEDGDGRDLLIWRLTWDTADDAGQFVRAHRDYMEARGSYSEEVPAFAGARGASLWVGQDQAIYVSQVSQDTLVVIAPTSEIIEQVLKLLPGF